MYPLRSLVLAFAMLACSNSANQESSANEPRPQPRPRAAEPAPSVTVMTYNVNFARHQRTETIEAIRTGEADVVFLQETNRRWERMIRAQLADHYPHMEFVDHRWAGGLAVLSKLPFETRAVLPSPIGKFPAWLVEVDSPLGMLQVMNLHLLPIKRGDENIVSRFLRTQEVRLRETRKYLAALDRSVPTLLVGDFNEDAQGQSLSLLMSRGFESALEAFMPNAPTWRWDTPVGEIRWQLDHILHTPDLRATWATIVEGGGSDHLPVVARIERAQDALTATETPASSAPAP